MAGDLKPKHLRLDNSPRLRRSALDRPRLSEVESLKSYYSLLFYPGMSLDVKQYALNETKWDCILKGVSS